MSSLKDLAAVTQPTISLLPSSLLIRIDKTVVIPPPQQSKQDSSGEDRNISDEDQTDTVEMSVMRTPVMVLRAHKGKCWQDSVHKIAVPIPQSPQHC